MIVQFGKCNGAGKLTRKAEHDTHCADCYRSISKGEEMIVVERNGRRFYVCKDGCLSERSNEKKL